MAREWTQAQLSAMNTRGRTLLISAAAGSGKTATLTERIIRRITDPENPVDLSKLLVVTFTKAAAAELKSRISKALSDAIANDPGNAHLQNQLIKMGSAHISTIDAFCYQPVKEHFAEAGMPASFRIADDAEMLPLKEKMMNDLIDEFYIKYSSEQNTSSAEPTLFDVLSENPFADICDSLSTFKSDEKLFDTLLKIYNELLNFPQGISRLKEEADLLIEDNEKDFFLTKHGVLLYTWTKTFCDSALVFYEQVLKDIFDDAAATKAYFDSLDSEYEFFKTLDQTLRENSYSKIRSLIHGFISKAFKACRNPAKDYSDLKKQRKRYMEELSKLRSEYYAATEDVIRKDARHLSSVCRVLHDFLETFDQRLNEEKKRRGICDFVDNRRHLLALLQNPDGTPTAFCQDYLSAYDEVYIDEYQDVDEVQDTIFSLIGGNHRFMVGDIKQSIYGFRGADPTVFARYRTELPPLANGLSQNGNSIFMSDNFRCDESVIRVTNAICGHIFGTCPDSIGYLPEDDLGFSKLCPESYIAPKVQITMISTKGKDEEEGPYSGTEAEACYVANQIAELLRNKVSLADGSIIRPKDIAILMRDSTHMPTYTAALSNMGIPTGCEELESTQAAKDLLHGADMIYLLNLLRVINNPNQDIPLSELLRCDFPGISLEQLITIRQLADPQASLHQALNAYRENDTVDLALKDKIEQFLQWIERYRMLSTSLDAEGLLRLIRSDERVLCRKTQAFRYLYEAARTCRVAPFTGLYTFLKYFESKLLTEKKVTAESSDTNNDGVVSLMTIHKSKGLEFPVCFVVRCGNAFKNKNASADLVFEKNSGLSTKFYDRKEHRKYDNILRKVSSLARYHQEKEEEMRILYVAMTRAKERLCLVGFSSDTRVPFPQKDRYSALTSGNYMDWIKAGLFAHPEIIPYCDIHSICENQIERGRKLTEQDKHMTCGTDRSVAEKYRALHALRISISPLEEILQSIPTKLPASKMRDSLLDECIFFSSDRAAEESEKLPVSEQGTLRFDAQSKVSIQKTLDLMETNQTPDEFELLLKANARPTAIEKGTAAHMFLQYCHWPRVFKNGIEEEISWLCNEGFITERVASILDRKQLTAFFESDFAKRVSKARLIERELKFQRFVPLQDLTENEILKESLEGRDLYVRGSIDLLCVFDDGRIFICDYKTDHFTKEEKEDRALLTEHIQEKHISQLKQYALAVEEMYGRRPDEVYIFALSLGDAIQIPLSHIFDT